MPSLRTLQQRARIVQNIRNFFLQRDYLELSTPRLSPSLLPESQLEVFSVPVQDAPPLFLTPSPEYWMKQYIAKGCGNVFEICRSYRNVEEHSPHHSPEFTMLEWYTLRHGSQDSLQVTLQLFRFLLSELDGVNSRIRRIFSHDVLVLSLEEAFSRWADVDLQGCTEDEQSMREACSRHGLSPEESWEAMFHKLFYHLIEPNLARDRPVCLMNYPMRLATLALPIEGTPWLDRWELYVSGVELANCYCEEKDPKRIAAYLAEEQQRKDRHCMVSHPIDMKFLQDPPLPSCSGVAMGIDRLVMLLLDKQCIADVSILSQ